MTEHNRPTPNGLSEWPTPLLTHFLTGLTDLNKNVGILIGETSAFRDEVIGRLNRYEQGHHLLSDRVLTIEKTKSRNGNGHHSKLSLSSILSVLKVLAHVPWGKAILTLQGLIAGGYMIASPGGARELVEAFKLWLINRLMAGG